MPIRNPALALTFALALAPIAGCGKSPGAPTDPEPSAAEFRAALPPLEVLRLGGPVGGPGDPGAHDAAPQPLPDGAIAILGQTADLYVLTRRTSAAMGGQIGAVLGLVGSIAGSPPSAVGPDAAVWGPMVPPLSPIAYRLVVQRGAGGRLGYHLDVRPKLAGEDAFQPIVVGAPEPVEPPRHAGGFQVNLALLHALDPVVTTGGGGLGAHYEVGPGGAALRLHAEAGPGGPAPADFLHLQAPDGGGVFQVRSPGGFVRSRWAPSGAGRADATMARPDGSGPVDASECWNEGFARVFFAARPAGGGEGEGTSEGDPAACAFADAIPSML